MREKLIALENIYKSYRRGEVHIPVLQGVSVQIDRSELVALVGASGSGKSTLMNILGCLDRPTSGKYWLDGDEVSALSADQRALLRSSRIGFVRGPAAYSAKAQAGHRSCAKRHREFRHHFSAGLLR